MEPDRFFDKVRFMRKCQKHYYLTKGWAALHDAKKAEQEVDDLIEMRLSGKNLTINFQENEPK